MLTPDYKITSAKYEEGFITLEHSKTNETYVSCKLAKTNKATNQIMVHWKDYSPGQWLFIKALGSTYNVAVSKMQEILAYLNSMDTENVYSFIQ